MTFSQSVKNEILHSVRLKDCCATAFLTAVIKAGGSLSLDFKGFGFTIESDNYNFLEFCRGLAFDLYQINSAIGPRNLNVNKVAVYTCEFDGHVGQKLGLTYKDSDNVMHLTEDVAQLIPTNECCKRSFVQGLFVSCGSVVIPLGKDAFSEADTHGKYHLELRFSDVAFANAVKDAFGEIDFKLAERKNTVILYLKDSEKIADFLVYVNAMNAKLQLENVIIGRSIRNMANRQRNCISANIDKSVMASEKQLSAITTLRNNGSYDTLPDNLKQIAELREQLPEATLDEISARLGISKSGANHRFAKIIQLAEK